MKHKLTPAFLAGTIALSLLLMGCTPPKPCPRLSSNADGTYTIGTPPPSSEPGDLAGCEYEFNENDDLETERDTD